MKQAPKHLGEAGKIFWKKTLREYKFEDTHEYERLADACVTRDTVAECIKKIEIEGLTILDRFGQEKPHVAVKIMHDAQALFLRIVRELGLNLTDEEQRPPRQYGG